MSMCNASCRALLALLAAGLAAACEDEPTLNRLPEPEIQVDELKQKAAALVDILWVVDNSGSMIEEQQALAENFQEFISGLTVCRGSAGEDDLCDFTSKRCTVSGAPCNPPDYHIGVISTDVRPSSTLDQGRLRRAGVCAPSPGASPAGGKTRYCQSDNRHCAHDAADPSSDPANSVCDMGNVITYVTPTTPNAAGAFSRLVQVGTGGAASERGIEAAARALGRHTDRNTGMFVPPPSENAGFVRPEASLFVIFVSDEDDDPQQGGTFGETSYFYRAFESLKGAGNEALVSLSAIVGNPDLDGDGPTRGGCPAPPGIATAAPGRSYIALSMYSRGLTAEFRVCDEQRLQCPANNACQRPVQGLPGICAPSGACTRDQDCGNFQCANGVGCVRCNNGQCVADAESFSQLLQNNGIFGSICDDYSQVLDALGFEAAGLSRKFPLTKYIDCTKTVPCNGKEETICVQVGEQFIPNDRQTGWVYDSSSNAVFFDGSFVPPTDAPIQVSYRVSRLPNESLSCEGIVK